MLRKLISIAVITALSGCTSLYGPPPIIGPAGPKILAPPSIRSAGSAAPQQRSDRTDADQHRTDLSADFVDRANSAAQFNDDGRIREFMRSGFSLVYANCNEFFWREGQNQSDARLGRDLIAPFVTLLTGAIALKNFTDSKSRDRLLQALSLSSAFVTSGLDLYDKHFLFGAENIDSVRELTFNALIAHGDQALKLDHVTYYDAITHLIDHQALCMPPHILSLTREAIAKGQVEARIIGSAPADPLAEPERQLGLLLNPPSRLSDEQLFALWWLYEGAPRREPTDEYAGIYALLAGLPQSSKPVTAKTENGKPVYTYAPVHEQEVKQALAALSPGETASFRQKLQKVRDPAAAVNLREVFPSTRSTPAGGSQRVSVGIRG